MILDINGAPRNVLLIYVKFKCAVRYAKRKNKHRTRNNYILLGILFSKQNKKHKVSYTTNKQKYLFSNRMSLNVNKD